MTPDWSRKFDEPIPLPKGRQLVTLKDAGTYITKLPKAEHMIAGMASGNGGPDLGGDARRQGRNAPATRRVGSVKSRRTLRAAGLRAQNRLLMNVPRPGRF